MNRINKGWLYGIIVMLSQTCNPDYQQPNPYANNRVGPAIENDGKVYIPDEALIMEEEIEVEPPRTVEAPPPPPMPEPEEEVVFKIVEQMPRFPGCENSGITDKGKLKICAEDKMLKFIYGNLKYPKVARENGIEGNAILQFTILEDGSVSKVRVLRDPGGGCGNEAKRVAESMPKWVPGLQRGKPVKVQYTLPVRFKLDSVKEKKN